MDTILNPDKFIIDMLRKKGSCRQFKLTEEEFKAKVKAVLFLASGYDRLPERLMLVHSYKI